MLVAPRPGIDRDNLLKTLRSVHADDSNLRGGGGSADGVAALIALPQPSG